MGININKDRYICPLFKDCPKIACNIDTAMSKPFPSQWMIIESGIKLIDGEKLDAFFGFLPQLFRKFNVLFVEPPVRYNDHVRPSRYAAISSGV